MNYKSGIRLAGCFLVILLLMNMAASVAFAAGSISGSVKRSSDSAAIAPVTVNVYDTSWNLVISAVNDGSGNYSIPNLPAGNYKLHSYNTLGYVDEYYTTGGGTAQRGSANSVTVTESTDTPNINFTLASNAGSISGTVTVSSGGPPLQNITVIAYQGTDSLSSPGNNYIAWTVTDVSGDYTIPGLAAGSYNVKTSNTLGYADEYFNEQYLFNLANPVTVTALTEIPDIDFALSIGGTISGRVTRKSDGAGIAGVGIRTMRSVDFSFVTPIKFYTDADGYYQVTGLAPGYYYVETVHTDYGNQMYPGVYRIYGAQAVPVALGTDTPDIDFSLYQGASISGRVARESDGAGLSSVGLTLYDTNWLVKDWATTDGSGNYIFRSIVPGSYYVESGAPSGYVPEKYNNASFRGTARAITIAEGAAITNIDISLASVPTVTTGSISGNVTAPSYSIVTIAAYDTNWNQKASTTFYGTSGSYTISGLAPGKYFVGVVPVTWYSSNVAHQYFNNATLRSAAAPVTVTAGSTTTGIIFNLSTGGSISGTITRIGDSAPIPNLSIQVYDAEWTSLKTVTTGLSGAYQVTGLATGSYYLRLRGAKGYIDEIYNDAMSLGAATPVAVTQGVGTPNVNFSLQPGYGIAGSVYGVSDSIGLPGITVEAYDSSWQHVMSCVTEDYPNRGAFNLEGLAPGYYYLKTSNNVGYYVDRYFFNANSQSDAIQIFVPDDALAEVTFAQFQLKHVLPTPVDVDSDETADVVVWRPGTNFWYAMQSGTPGSYVSVRWGWTGDILVPGDYDGDGMIDPATWWPEGGYWFILPSDEWGTYIATQWGLPTDKPVPGDYDGDGKDDLAVWRPGSGEWYILKSSDPGSYITQQWGAAGDIPVPRDYDGDGKVDVAVWRQSTGTWYILPSESPGTFLATQWGVSTDKPVPGDYDGDAKIDIAVWRPADGHWYILPSNSPGGLIDMQWGLAGDVPVPGDYDGDGKTDIAVWRPDMGMWYALESGNPGVFTMTPWGLPTDLPISSVTGILELLP